MGRGENEASGLGRNTVHRFGYLTMNHKNLAIVYKSGILEYHGKTTINRQIVQKSSQRKLSE